MSSGGIVSLLFVAWTVIRCESAPPSPLLQLSPNSTAQGITSTAVDTADAAPQFLYDAWHATTHINVLWYIIAALVCLICCVCCCCLYYYRRTSSATKTIRELSELRIQAPHASAALGTSLPTLSALTPSAQLKSPPSRTQTPTHAHRFSPTVEMTPESLPRHLHTNAAHSAYASAVQPFQPFQTPISQHSDTSNSHVNINSMAPIPQDVSMDNPHSWQQQLQQRHQLYRSAQQHQHVQYRSQPWMRELSRHPSHSNRYAQQYPNHGYAMPAANPTMQMPSRIARTQSNSKSMVSVSDAAKPVMQPYANSVSMAHANMELAKRPTLAAYAASTHLQRRMPPPRAPVQHPLAPRQPMQYTFNHPQLQQMQMAGNARTNTVSSLVPTINDEDEEDEEDEDDEDDDDDDEVSASTATSYDTAANMDVTPVPQNIVAGNQGDDVKQALRMDGTIQRRLPVNNMNI